MYLPPGPIPPDAASHWLACEGLWSAPPDEPVAALPPQVDTAYRLLRNGHTEVEVRLAIQEQYGKGARPNLAFKNALDLVIREQRAAREHLPELVMAVRWNAIQKAIQGGQLGAAAAMLRDVGAACGESALDAAGATLLVEVLPPGPQSLPEASTAGSEATQAADGAGMPENAFKAPQGRVETPEEKRDRCRRARAYYAAQEAAAGA